MHRICRELYIQGRIWTGLFPRRRVETLTDLKIQSKIESWRRKSTGCSLNNEDRERSLKVASGICSISSSAPMQKGAISRADNPNDPLVE